MYETSPMDLSSTTESDMRNVSVQTRFLDQRLFNGYSDDLLTFATVTCTVFIVLGIPGNLVTIVALLRSKKARNATAIFIMNLSLSDLLFCCFNLPLAASTFYNKKWVHGEVLCRLFPFMRYGLMGVSLFTILAITINRYVMIGHPRAYLRIYRTRYLVIMVTGTWLISFIALIPTWRGVWGVFGLDREIGSCTILQDKNGSTPKEFLFVVAFVIPCIAIIICYARIFYIVRKAAIKAVVKTTDMRTKQSVPPMDVNLNGEQPAYCIETTDNNQSKSQILDPTALVQTPKLNQYSWPDLQIGENTDFESAAATHSSSRNNMIELPVQEQTDRRYISRKNTPSLSRFSSHQNRRNRQPVVSHNTSGASILDPGQMSHKDRRLLRIILAIFLSFLICYLPITIAKIAKQLNDIHIFNIMGYLLIYLTTCVNPIIYVVMSSEYRRAYWNALTCKSTLYS